MNHDLNSGYNLSANNGNRKLLSHQNHHLEPRYHIPHAIGVRRPQTSGVSCVQAHQKILCLRSSHLSDDDPARPHSESSFNQIPDRYGMTSLQVCVSRLHPNQIRNALKLKFGVILDRNDALLRWNTG